MQVNKIQTNQPNFGSMIITKKGAKVLENSFSKDQLTLINDWGKNISNTKHFDLIIDAIVNDLFLAFKHKTNPKYDSEAPLYPIASSENFTQFVAYGIDLLDCGDSLYYDLRFPTVREGSNAYITLCKDRSNYVESGYRPFEKIKWAIDSTKILDDSFEYMKNRPLSPKSTKPSFTQRLKKAWQALKGN